MKYDLAIIGAGPAGLSASVYASRYGIKNVVIGGIAGGLVTETHEIGNWLGAQKISGFEFAQKAVEHVKSLGVNIESVNVDQIEKEKDAFELFLSSGKKVQAKTVLLTMGTKHRHLGIPGEKELAGKGVSYCATCDGFFYREKITAVVGGSDSAASAALHLAGIAEKVYLIYRGEKLRAENFWVESILKNKKIEVLYNTNIKEIKGEQKVEEIVLDNPFCGSEVLKTDGIFIEIGLEPNVNLVENLNIDLDEEGYIKIESDGRTSEKGIWAAGDITTGSNKFKQIVTAAAEGAIATASIQKHLKK
ncbi:MAG: Uncharacterized protein Athens071425_12 [Parcubacteria group bacterium Athens0714_25]|nr:MAG: Uncharacterized protein Athens071425_12 [Parcubacteria group bacterium Athens0714_25]